MESGLNAMIDGNRIEDLNRMYKLFFNISSATGGPQTLRKALRESVLSRGKAINEANDPTNVATAAAGSDDEKDAKEKPKTGVVAQVLNVALKWVQDTLDLKDKFDLILKQAFESDRLCETTITDVRSTAIHCID